MAARDLPLVEELASPVAVAQALRSFAHWPGVILLDSARRSDPRSRHSFLTADPFEWHTLDGHPGPDPLLPLRQALTRCVSPAIPGLPPFQGGAAGLLSYDLGRAWERIPLPRSDEFRMPLLAAGVYDWTIAWDHAQDRAWIISQGFPESDRSARTDRAARRLQQVRQALERPPSIAKPPRPATIRNPQSPIPQPPPRFPTPHPLVTSNFTRDGYLAAVRRAIEYIHAGDVFQVNLSQRLLAPLSEPPLELYLRLRERNAAPFAAYFAAEDWAIASASPERFLSVVDGEVESRPIKGTRRRNAAPEADLFTRDALRESQKDQAENVMIVDLLRNDLSRVCQPGTIRVPALCQVETYETVQHLVSEVRGRLRPGRTAWDVIAAAFPGGSVTGAPKVRAQEIIAELEPSARGPYCGSLFYVSFNGRADSSILIRTFTARHGWLQFPVGGGIVAQSDPAAEYAETWHKAEGMLRALR